MERIFKSIDLKENRLRFYTMHIEKSLFGEFTLTSTWGRIGSKGQSRVAPFNSIEECIKEMDKIAKIRKRHGYEEMQ